MRKNLFTTLLLQEKWRRNALPGLLWSKNEEEWVYQASSEGAMQTNCSTRPSRSQKKRRIGVQERPLSSRAEKTQSHTIAVLYGRRFSGLNLNQNFKAISLQYLQTKIEEIWSTKPPLKGKLRIALPCSLFIKDEEELLYQACSTGKTKKICFTRPSPGQRTKKNCSTKPPLKGTWRRIALPVPSLETMEKNCSTKHPSKGKRKRIALPGSFYRKIRRTALLSLF